MSRIEFWLWVSGCRMGRKAARLWKTELRHSSYYTVNHTQGGSRQWTQEGINNSENDLDNVLVCSLFTRQSNIMYSVSCVKPGPIAPLIRAKCMRCSVPIVAYPLGWPCHMGQILAWCYCTYGVTLSIDVCIMASCIFWNLIPGPRPMFSSLWLRLSMCSCA